MMHLSHFFRDSVAVYRVYQINSSGTEYTSSYSLQEHHHAESAYAIDPITQLLAK